MIYRTAHPPRGTGGLWSADAKGPTADRGNGSRSKTLSGKRTISGGGRTGARGIESSAHGRIGSREDRARRRADIA